MTSPTTSELDPATQAAIRKALAAAQLGRLAEACAAAEQALADGGDQVALNAMLGMLRGRSGDRKGAIRHLEIAHRAKPQDVRIATNLAGALIAQDDFEGALQVAASDLALSDPTLQLARIRGYAAQMAEKPAEAAAIYERVVDAAPSDWESWNNLGNARLAIEDVEGGISALRRAAELNPEAAPTRLNLARAFRKSGDLAETERQLRAMADHFPEDTLSLLDLRDLLKELGRPDEEVVEVLERAVEREPDNPELLLALGRQLVLLLNMVRAEQLFRRALTREPTNSEAFVGLVTVYEHSRPANLNELVREAEAAGVDLATRSLLRAFAYRRAKAYAEGLAALEKVPGDFMPVRREELLGQFHDRLGNYDAAFSAFTRMNEAQAAQPTQPLIRAAKLRARTRERREQTTAEWITGWRTPPIRPERPAPTFLVGFPRSGTTLLDTMLMGHPDVAVMEERPALANTGTALGGFDRIAELSEAEIRRAQEHYFEEANRHVQVRDGMVLIDKSPMLLNSVPMIYRLFPNARFILALRHPADSLLSCFVSNFRANSSMSNFLQLDTAAEFYDLTFRNWENSRALFPLEVHTIVYERLVENPEQELRRLSDALELRWMSEMLDHTKTAAERGLITTASYAQVTEPIYNRSVGRWRSYRDHLEPILPVLKPWAEKFGYSLDA